MTHGPKGFYGSNGYILCMATGCDVLVAVQLQHGSHAETVLGPLCVELWYQQSCQTVSVFGANGLSLCRGLTTC